MYHILPDMELTSEKYSGLFREKGLLSFHQACEFVWQVPYGRTSNPSDFTLVLEELKGTCSSKHALLKLLADELGLDVALVMGIYPMTESNTPGVGKILEEAQLEYLPEAHCYLRYGQNRVDLTNFASVAVEQINEFFIEVPLSAQELVARKAKAHKEFLAKHYGVEAFEEIWQVRERCIAALSMYGV